jgi:hypothetical protein
MNATIENSFCFDGIFKYGDGSMSHLLKEFIQLLIAITISKDEKMLRNFIKSEFSKSEFFNIGFGGSHMWIKQINNNNRLLIVYF